MARPRSAYFLGSRFCLSSSGLTLHSTPSVGTSSLAVHKSGVQHQLAKVRVAPVLVRMSACESEAAAAVGPLDGPRQHLVAPLGGDDVGIRAAGGGRLAASGLVVGLGRENRA